MSTSVIGEFLRLFASSFRSGDSEWIRSAVDKGGIIEEVRTIYFGFLGPKEGGEVISDLTVKAAPPDYKVPNSLVDAEIDSTIPVDFLITFKRNAGGSETKVTVPAGYREGKIWLAGIKKK